MFLQRNIQKKTVSLPMCPCVQHALINARLTFDSRKQSLVGPHPYLHCTVFPNTENGDNIIFQTFLFVPIENFILISKMMLGFLPHLLLETGSLTKNLSSVL